MSAKFAIIKLAIMQCACDLQAMLEVGSVRQLGNTLQLVSNKHLGSSRMPAKVMQHSHPQEEANQGREMATEHKWESQAATKFLATNNEMPAKVMQHSHAQEEANESRGTATAHTGGRHKWETHRLL